MHLLIRGGRVIDPAQKLDQTSDVLIIDGKVARVERGIAPSGKVLDAKDKVVIPGLIDLHVHLREPGGEHKETIASGANAAVAGGFTAVCCMANTTPTNDCRSVTDFIRTRAEEARAARVYPIGAITRGLAGKVLAELADMKEGGIVACSDDGKGVMDAGLMRHALEYASTFGLPVLQHCEDAHLAAGGAMHEGIVATRTGISGQPAQAESTLLARDIELVELTGARYHALHLSTRAALGHVRRAKAAGLPVTCEVAPHHFSLTDEACVNYDSNAKVSPPLRSGEHVSAVLEAIADGTVDAIATDHAPHADIDKEVEFGLAAFGISGLETALPLSLELWRKDVVSLARLVHLLSTGPAQVLGLPGGSLRVGAAADVTVIDPDLEWVCDPAQFVSKGKNTPFAGHKMRGAALWTIVGGELKYERVAAPRGVSA